jgi:uncharacterized protein YgbK (DUF1537 family)
MAQVAIVADDLTGALDTAARWTDFGLRTILALTTAPLPDTPAVAIHTASRAATAGQAYRRAKEAAQRLGGRYVYKKVDSTLRGNVGAEVEGLLDGLGLQRALLAPTFPAAGRTVQGGILRIHGVPLAESEYSHDSQSPAWESHVPTLLARQTQRTVGHLTLEVVSRGEDAIRQALQNCEAQLVVADAVETEHLYALARAAMHMPQPWLCCGSAGLADGWLQALGFTRSAAKPFCWEAQAGPVLVVAGSRHPATARELERAQDIRELHLVHLALDETAIATASNPELEATASRVFGGTASRHRWGETEGSAQWSRASRMLAEGRPVALTTTFSTYLPGGEARAAALLARATAWICGTVQVLGLILTGGDTAEAVCAAIGMTGVQVMGEVQPGVPAASGSGGQGDGLRLVTKAGGFGDELTIVRGIDFIQGLH